VKNIPRLLAVSRQLLQTNPDVHFALAGEGLDRRLVDGTDLGSASRLHCLGPRGDIPSLLQDATLLLLTSDSEGMPNVVLEALAVGVPVVSTAVGDLAQMLPEQCGVLVPCDTEPLVAAVRRVIADAPSFARAVEQYATHMRTTHSVQAMASRTVDVWRSVVPPFGIEAVHDSGHEQCVR
jgi:glycosyltransferase involved in cell wall biosynthesis